MFKKAMMYIWGCAFLFLFSCGLHAEGGIYFKCVVGANEYLGAVPCMCWCLSILEAGSQIRGALLWKPTASLNCFAPLPS